MPSSFSISYCFTLSQDMELYLHRAPRTDADILWKSRFPFLEIDAGRDGPDRSGRCHCLSSEGLRQKEFCLLCSVSTFRYIFPFHSVVRSKSSNVGNLFENHNRIWAQYSNSLALSRCLSRLTKILKNSWNITGYQPIIADVFAWFAYKVADWNTLVKKEILCSIRT